MKKVCFCRTEFSFTKNIVHRYLEEKWTYSYIDKLDDFVKTIKSRVYRINKFATNKVTKKDVPRLVSLSAETTVSQTLRFFVGDFVRIVRKDIVFRKGYKQSFTGEVFEITDFPTLFPPSYSLIDATKNK